MKADKLHLGCEIQREIGLMVVASFLEHEKNKRTSPWSISNKQMSEYEKWGWSVVLKTQEVDSMGRAMLEKLKLGQPSLAFLRENYKPTERKASKVHSPLAAFAILHYTNIGSEYELFCSLGIQLFSLLSLNSHFEALFKLFHQRKRFFFLLRRFFKCIGVPLVAFIVDVVVAFIVDAVIFIVDVVVAFIVDTVIFIVIAVVVFGWFGSIVKVGEDDSSELVERRRRRGGEPFPQQIEVLWGRVEGGERELLEKVNSILPCLTFFH